MQEPFYPSAIVRPHTHKSSEVIGAPKISDDLELLQHWLLLAGAGDVEQSIHYDGTLDGPQYRGWLGHEFIIAQSSASILKMLDTGLFFGRQYSPKVVALTDGATINTDASKGNVFTVTIGGNRTMAAPTNPTNGQRITYRIKQDATGSRTMTWNAAFRFGTTIPSPTLTTTANKTDYIEFVYNSADSKWDVVSVRLGY